MIPGRIVKKVIHRIQVTRKVDFEPDIWDKVITINRKDTYDTKLSKRRIQLSGRGAARSGQSAGGGARVDEDSHGNATRGEAAGPRCRNKGRLLGASLQRGRCEARPATGEKREVAAHGSEARRKDQRPGNPGGRSSRIYPGIQGRGGEAPGRQRAQERHHARAERGHRRPQVPAGDANQLRSGRRRITNRALRGPSPRYRIKLQAASKPQARTKLQAASAKLQATSHKQQAPGSRPLDKVSGCVDRGSLLRYTCL
jgi:hypothetical protein